MPKGFKQLLLLMEASATTGNSSKHGQALSTRRVLLKQGRKRICTPAKRAIVRRFLAELSPPPVLVILVLHWDEVAYVSRPFFSYTATRAFTNLVPPS